MATVFHGRHVYKLFGLQKLMKFFNEVNPEDSYAVSVTKDNTIIGNVSCEKPRVTWYFVEYDESNYLNSIHYWIV